MYLKYPYYDKTIKCTEQPVAFPPQHQDIQPGLEYLMVPLPISEDYNYQGSGKLEGKVAIITVLQLSEPIPHEACRTTF